MQMMVSDDQYMDIIQKFINGKLKRFEEAGGWNVGNEKAKHCTYHRYLEVGIEDCKNTAKLIESLVVALKTVKREMQAEVERLEARQFERTNFVKMVEIIDNATKRTENIYESCATNANMDGKLTEKIDQVLCVPSTSILESSTSEFADSHQLQVTADISKSSQINASRQAEREPTKNLVEKLCRPPASLTGSFTVDQDEDTVTFLEPLRILTFQDATMDDTLRTKDSLNQIINSSKKNVAAVHISEPPAMKSELAKQWIREVARKCSN
ncbi:Checkpoint protein [Dirofilaria immitis]